MGGQKTMGVIHNEAYNFLKVNYKQIWVISLILYGVQLVLGTVFAALYMPLQFLFALFTVKINGFPHMSSAGDFLSSFLPVFGVLGIVMLVGYTITAVSMIAEYASYIGGFDATVRLYGGQKPAFDAVMKNFTKNWKRYIGSIAWALLWYFLWSLLFIVPGIVKYYSYRLVPFIVIQYPELTIREALKKSIELTDGYKGRLFGIDVILGLYLIASVVGICCFFVGTLAIQVLWLTPMMLGMYTISYLDIRQAAIEKGLLPPDPIQ